MTVDCSWSRKDLKKYLEKKRRVPNRIFLILGICFFFYITYYGWVQDEYIDKKVLLLGLIVYIFILVVFLWLTTKLYVIAKLHRNDVRTAKAYGEYHIQADTDKIVSAVGEETFAYDWKDISSYRIRKNYFFLSTKKDKLGLCFHREILKDDYDKLLAYVKEQLSVS